MVVVIMESNIKVGNHVKKSKEEKKLPTFTSQEKVKREGVREIERERERERERKKSPQPPFDAKGLQR